MPSTRVLLVEDNCLIALGMTDELRDERFEVVGPEASLDKAVVAASEQEFDIALLDLEIRGGAVYPVADILLDRNMPFAFLTGHQAGAVAPTYQGVPVVEKPAPIDSVVRTLRLLPLAT